MAGKLPSTDGGLSETEIGASSRLDATDQAKAGTVQVHVLSLPADGEASLVA